MTRTFDEWMEKGEKGWATPSGQPAGGPSDLSRYASQPNGAHQAHGAPSEAQRSAIYSALIGLPYANTGDAQ